MTSSKILFFLCLFFIIGVFIGSVAKIPQIFLWGFLFLAVLLIFATLVRHCEPQRSNLTDFRLLRRLRPPRNDELFIFSFCVLFFIIGVLRLQISEFNIKNSQLRKLNNKGEVVLFGKIVGEPDIRENSQKLKIEIYSAKSVESSVPPKAEQSNRVENLVGVVLVTIRRYPEYKYGDRIKIIGKLEEPDETEDFSYKNYLMKDGIYSVMAFPKTELLEKEPYRGLSSIFFSGVLEFKQKLRESIRKNYSPPQSLILEGTVLGDNGVMSQDLKDKLNITGLRHIIAVSGTHVIILSTIIMSLLLALGFWRGQAFYITIIFICLYIVMTGLPASGVRAGIMGGLYLLSQKLGRQSVGPRVIILSCAIMLLINPLLLFYDIGFQLSFLAVMGLIYLEPFIKNFLKILTKIILPAVGDKVENLLGMISATFAAQIFTLPIIVYNFGNISLVSPITNILVLPVVYWLMIFGFLSSFLGIISQFLGWIFALPSWLLLSYFLKITDFFSQEWCLKTIKSTHWIWLIIFYIILATIVYWLHKE